MLVTERPGRMRVVGKDGRLDPAPVAGLPRIDAQGQGGLLDVALHPRYRDNGWIYWSYSQRDAAGDNGTEVARGRLAGGPGAWRMDNVEVVFRMAPKSGAGFHFGSRLVFDRDGLLYVTLGDRGEMARAQKLDDHAGKILRLTDEGKPAPGNPFLNDPKAQAGDLFARQPQRAGRGAASEDRHAVGARARAAGRRRTERDQARRQLRLAGDHLRRQLRLGTKIGEGTEKAGMAQPVKYWVPSPALAGMAFYDGDRFPKWRGDVLIGALRGQALIRVRLDGEKFVDDEFMLVGHLPRMRDVRVGPDGLVYLLTDQPNGAILRLEPAG
jgi:aldose sugar dehydrogenase